MTDKGIKSFSDLLQEDAENAIQDVSLKDLSAKAAEMVDLANEIAEMEALLESKKQAYREIEAVTLPDMMVGLGVKEFSLQDGSKITIKDIVQASLPSQGAILKAQGDERDALVDRKHRALEWMRAHGGEAIIKNNVSVDFGKGQDAVADKLVGFLKEIGVEYDRSTNVHAASLTAYIKEKIANGADVPFDLFGVYTGFKAVLKQPRKIG